MNLKIEFESTTGQKTTQKLEGLWPLRVRVFAEQLIQVFHYKTEAERDKAMLDVVALNTKDPWLSSDTLGVLNPGKFQKIVVNGVPNYIP